MEDLSNSPNCPAAKHSCYTIHQFQPIYYTYVDIYNVIKISTIDLGAPLFYKALKFNKEFELNELQTGIRGLTKYS